ncbi:uncharacterized protein LOC103098944 isoform X2 [Monodelphis domestica]|nr:uncharacterized protein LOC103098944 isoform X2 [Monodelphis domestica]XP_007473418.1 uncharacterized protein LOC103098944 isoform X2 [Monodelphis domestica]
MIPFGKASPLGFSEDGTDTRVSVDASSSTPQTAMPLEYLPYFRTYEGTDVQPPTLNLGVCLQEEEITKEKEYRSIVNVRHKEDQKDFVPSSGYFSYYRSQEEYFVNPLLQSKTHSGKSKTEERRGNTNKTFESTNNHRDSLLSLQSNFDLHSSKNSPSGSSLPGETSEESQLPDPLYSDDCSTEFTPYYRTEEVLRASSSSVPRGHE